MINNSSNMGNADLYSFEGNHHSITLGHNYNIYINFNTILKTHLN